MPEHEIATFAAGFHLKGRGDPGIHAVEESPIIEP
ncbi:MAG: hypothetical protein XD88_1814 [Methanocalculus sp. 52_23]|nr:MAG: hypothetical protein XD88_1814 [Methanocalculus sp. 52_23]